MKIHKSISHLTGKEQNDLHIISKRIVENIQPQFIFCYGSRVTTNLNRSCLTEKHRVEKTTCCYDILLVVSDEEPLEDNAILLFTERLLKKEVQVNVIVHRIGFIYQQILKENFFIVKIFESAIILYDKIQKLQSMPLTTMKVKHTAMIQSIYLLYKTLFDESKVFISKAEACYAENNYVQAVHLLKQSVIRSLKALVMAGTGYAIATDNIERLVRFTENFTDLAGYLIDDDTNEGKRLCKLLTFNMPADGVDKELPTSVECYVLINRAKFFRQQVNDFLFKNATLLKYSQPGAINVTS